MEANYFTILFSISYLFVINIEKIGKYNSAATVAKSLQSCPTLCNPIDSSPPGTAFPGILQARTLEWVAISFSNAWKWKVKVKLLSHIRLFVTPWTAAYQAPLSMAFSRQEYWSGLPLPSPQIYLWNDTNWRVYAQRKSTVKLPYSLLYFIPVCYLQILTPVWCPNVCRSSQSDMEFNFF